MRLSKIRNVLGLLLKAAEIGTLVAVILLAVKMRYVMADADAAVKDTQKTIAELRQRVVDTSQNANAVLLQLGMAADEARRASGEQRQYLGKMSQEGVAILADARHAVQTLDQTIAKIGSDADNLSAASVVAINNISPVLGQSAETLKSAQTLISDPEIPKAVKSLADASQNTAAATASLALAAGDVQKKVHELTKPVSFVKSLFSSLLGWAAQFATILK